MKAADNLIFLFPQSPHVDLQEQSLGFSAVGHGAQGEKKYGFNLRLLRLIDTEVK